MTTINEKRQHNLRLPISRIPNEILSRIFCNSRNNSVNHDAPGWQRRKHGLKSLKGWIRTTHVCHAWREVAVNTSLLWCHIDFSEFSLRFLNWIPELLRRSKQSLLTVFVGSAAENKHRLLDEVKKHFGRTRELVLDGTTMDEIFSSQANFPNLETLNIALPLCYTPFVLSDSHLRTEHLRRLNLDFCSVDWNSKFLQNLTHLRLMHLPEGYKLGCRDFMLILSKTPALETLVLSDRNETDDDEEVQTHHQMTKIHLQHLRQLHVTSHVPEMAQFLSSLVVPRLCKLYLRTLNDYHDDAIGDKFRVILLWTSNHFRVPTTLSDASDHGQYIRSFHLVHHPDRGIVDFKVKGFSDVLSHEQLETADPILEFVVDWSYEDDNFCFNLQTFLSSLPLNGVISLDFDNDMNVDLSPEFWLVVFGSIQTLKTIYFEAITTPFWQALTPANGDIPFPALASVTVEDHYLDPQLILDKLRVRSESGGTKLQELYFSTEGLVPPVPIMAQLEGLVSHTQIMEILENPVADIEDDED